MTQIPVFNSLIDEADSAVKLSQYAQILGLSEDQFWGLNNSATLNDSCNPIWTLLERQTAARYLREAQTEIELVTGFPLSPRWFVDEFKYYGFPIHARWTKIIAAGFRNTSTISLAAVPSYVTDPCVVIVATTVTDEDEIAVFHPGNWVAKIYLALVGIVKLEKCVAHIFPSFRERAAGWPRLSEINRRADIVVKERSQVSQDNGRPLFRHQQVEAGTLEILGLVAGLVNEGIRDRVAKKDQWIGGALVKF